MTANPVEQLEIFGPESCRTLTISEARAFCRRLAMGRYENFSVLSSLVPRDRRDDFAALYAFCRWADDLGDEVADCQRSLELLGWWRRELESCYEGRPHHPVFMALAPVIERADLPMQLFDDLIRAFEQDQQVMRYRTWDQVIDYCRLSANPVGRLVLMIMDEQRSDTTFECSDAICTALQLTNHWQDIKRDILTRDRIYVPGEMIHIDRFEERLIASARQGYAIDRLFLPESRLLVRQLILRTWEYYEDGQKHLSMITSRSRPVVWLLAAGGQNVLRLIEMWNFETVLHRPTLSKPAKLWLVASAMMRRRFGGFNGEG